MRAASRGRRGVVLEGVEREEAAGKVEKEEEAIAGVRLAATLEVLARALAVLSMLIRVGKWKGGKGEESKVENRDSLNWLEMTGNLKLLPFLLYAYWIMLTQLKKAQECSRELPEMINLFLLS